MSGNENGGRRQVRSGEEEMEGEGNKGWEDRGGQGD